MTSELQKYPNNLTQLKKKKSTNATFPISTALTPASMKKTKETQFQQMGDGNGRSGDRIGLPSRKTEKVPSENLRSQMGPDLNKRQQSRHYSSPIVISRYRQVWKLVTFAPRFLKSVTLDKRADIPTSIEPGTRIVRVRMELDFTAPDDDSNCDSDKSQSYKRAYKSIASDFMHVQNIIVTESNNGIDTSNDVVTLQHNLTARENYQYLSFDFHKPLISSSSKSIVVTYDLINAIEGCRRIDGTCMEFFAAPWANQWDVPVIVSDVKYQLEIEIESMMLGSYNASDANITTAAAKDDWIRYDGMGLFCDASVSCNSSNCEVTTSNSSSIEISCPSLDTTSNLSPEQPEFQWSLEFDRSLSNSTTLDLGPQCKSTECHANHSTTSFFVYLGNTIIAFLIIMVVIMRVWKDQRMRMQEERDNMAAAAAARREKERERMKKEEGIKTLPTVTYGADNEKVTSAIRTYHDILKSREKVGEFEVVKVQEERSHYHQQLVACGSCTSCSICLTDFEESEEVLILPHCGHVFHHACIREWLVARSRDTCPLCQREVGLG